MRGHAIIRGQTPILMHRDAFDDENPEEKIVSGGKPGDDRYPPDKWKEYLYIESGVVVCPEACIKAALENAGARIKLGRTGTLKRPIVAGLFFDAPFLPLLVGGKTIAVADINAIRGKFTEQRELASALGITLDVRRVKVQSARHVRVRPRFDNWRVEGDFETVDLEGLSFPRIVECFRIAGSSAGLMDYRPSSPKRAGSFGRFTAEVQEL